MDSCAAVVGWLISNTSSWPPQWHNPQPAWQRGTAELSSLRTFPVPLVYNVASLGLSLETQLPYIFLEARHLYSVSWGHASCWQQWKDDFMRLAACAPVSAFQAGRRLGFFFLLGFFFQQEDILWLTLCLWFTVITRSFSERLQSN